MEFTLRRHPYMSYRGLRNWPPTWIGRGRKQEHCVQGEVGILKQVIPAMVKPDYRIFLVIQYEDAEYMGCLLFDNESFCRRMEPIFRAYTGCTIEYIGGLDLSHLL